MRTIDQAVLWPGTVTRPVSVSAILAALVFDAAFYYLCRAEVNKAFEDAQRAR